MVTVVLQNYVIRDHWILCINFMIFNIFFSGAIKKRSPEWRLHGERGVGLPSTPAKTETQPTASGMLPKSDFKSNQSTKELWETLKSKLF